MAEMDSLAYWKGLQQKAEAGTLRVSPDDAAELVKDCGDRLDDIYEGINMSRRLTRISGLGNFPVADIIARKYEAKGVEMQHVLDEHHELVQIMKDTIDKAIRNYVEMDDRTRRHLDGMM